MEEYLPTTWLLSEVPGIPVWLIPTVQNHAGFVTPGEQHKITTV